LLILMFHENSEEGKEESGIEDWRQLSSNLDITFLDFVNVDDTIMTVATMTIEELC
jgi:hypothetical protein